MSNDHTLYTIDFTVNSPNPMLWVDGPRGAATSQSLNDELHEINQTHLKDKGLVELRVDDVRELLDDPDAMGGDKQLHLVAIYNGLRSLCAQIIPESFKMLVMEYVMDRIHRHSRKYDYNSTDEALSGLLDAYAGDWETERNYSMGFDPEFFTEKPAQLSQRVLTETSKTLICVAFILGPGDYNRSDITTFAQIMYLYAEPGDSPYEWLFALELASSSINALGQQAADRFRKDAEGK